MPKLYTHTHTRQLLFGAVALIAMWSACTKLDVSHNQEQPAHTAQNFFTAPKQTDPKAKQIINFLQRQNDTLHYVDNTISRVGFSVWEKMMLVPGKLINHSRGGGGNENPDTYYIPFVRENEAFVNAVLVVQTSTNSDTTFSWRCDWQYHNLSRGQTAATDSAGMYATFFISVNHIVFD